MKKSIISMGSSESLQLRKMFITTLMVVMLGTGTSYGSTKNTHFKSTKTEQVVKTVNHSGKTDKQCDCKTCKDLVKKQQQKKQTKQCNCKECQKKQQKKSGPTCKMQTNTQKIINKK